MVHARMHNVHRCTTYTANRFMKQDKYILTSAHVHKIRIIITIRIV